MKISCKKIALIGVLCSMAVSCGKGVKVDFEDFQDGIQIKTETTYNWTLLPFCRDRYERKKYYVVTLKNGNVVEAEIDYNKDKYIEVVMAAAEAKDFKMAEFFFSKLKSEAISGQYKANERYLSCLPVYLMCKVTTLMEDGSLEAKDQIVSFLDSYETVYEADAEGINEVCNDILSRAIRKGDRHLAERIIKCYRKDPKWDNKKEEYVYTWKSKEAAKQEFAQAEKNGDFD